MHNNMQPAKQQDNVVADQKEKKEEENEAGKIEVISQSQVDNDTSVLVSPTEIMPPVSTPTTETEAEAMEKIKENTEVKTELAEEQTVATEKTNDEMKTELNEVAEIPLLSSEIDEKSALSITNDPKPDETTETEFVKSTLKDKINEDEEDMTAENTNEIKEEDEITAATSESEPRATEATEMVEMKTTESAIQCTTTTEDVEMISEVTPMEELADGEKENTILLPEPDNQLVEKLTVGENVVTDEQVIAIKTEVEANNVQEDVLAEPLDDDDNLYAANIDVKPIESILKIEPPNVENEEINKVEGRRRTTRKSAVAAAAAIRIKSDTSPELDYELSRTRSSGKRKSIKDRKKAKLRKIKVERSSEDDDSRGIPMDIERCRICLSKDALVNIFSTEDLYTVAGKVMNICSTVKISERDQLPQFVCNNCVQSVNVAFNLKILCEKTDKELRIKLKKSRIKKERVNVKRETVNYNNDNADGAIEDIEEKDDDFVVSNESEQSANESDSDSDFISKRKRTLRKKKTSGLKKRGKSTVASGRKLKRNRSRRSERKSIENGKVNQEDVTTDGELGPSKRKRSKVKTTKTDDDENNKKREPKEHRCIYCDEKFNSRNLLREHKKKHAGQKPLTCDICKKQFKLLGSYNTHVQKHNEEDDFHCSECNKHFANKTEHKKHLLDVHQEIISYKCDKCKKDFSTQSRLDKHKEGKCSINETVQRVKKEKKRNSEIEPSTSGKDLFKCVAPMTTTHWSDEISD